MGSDGPCFAITPDTLMLCGNGRVQINESSFDMVVDKSLVPAEYSDSVANFSEAAVEKVYSNLLIKIILKVSELVQ